MIKAFFASLLMLAGWFCPGAGECAELAASEREVPMQLAQRSDAGVARIAPATGHGRPLRAA